LRNGVHLARFAGQVERNRCIAFYVDAASVESRCTRIGIHSVGQIDAGAGSRQRIRSLADTLKVIVQLAVGPDGV